jgi:hypothetical protein
LANQRERDGPRRGCLNAVAVQESGHEGFPDAVNLALGQRQHGNDVDPTGQRLSRSRDGGVLRRPRKDVPARAQIPVELRLDGIEELGNIPAVSRIPGAVFPFSGL